MALQVARRLRRPMIDGSKTQGASGLLEVRWGRPENSKPMNLRTKFTSRSESLQH